jgi:hypothetical protein
MTSKEMISAELSALSPTVAAIPARNVFSVPDGYFENVGTHILAYLKEETIGSLPVLATPLHVPAGYFNALAGDILHRIKTGSTQTAVEETAAVSSLVAGIGNRNVFAAPANYFHALPGTVMATLPMPAKLIPIKRNTGIIRYMAAAVITGVVGLSVFSVFNNRNSGNGLLLPANTSVIMADAGQIIKNNSFNQELEKVSDSDIEQYLAQNGQDVNAALVAASLDDNNLPATEDYLLDENALNEFLNQANLIN